MYAYVSLQCTGLYDYGIRRQGSKRYKSKLSIIKGVFALHDDNIAIYELGVDDLPEDVRDIRDNIYDRLDAVYAVVGEDGDRYYFGINKVD